MGENYSDYLKNGFYLTALNSKYDLPRKCDFVKRLSDGIRDDLMLVSIDPPLDGKIYSTLGDRSLKELVLSAYDKKISLFPEIKFPECVQISYLVNESRVGSGILDNADLKVLDRGDIYLDKQEAENNVASRYLEI